MLGKIRTGIVAAIISTTLISCAIGDPSLAAADGGSVTKNQILSENGLVQTTAYANLEDETLVANGKMPIKWTVVKTDEEVLAVTNIPQVKLGISISGTQKLLNDNQMYGKGSLFKPAFLTGIEGWILQPANSNASALSNVANLRRLCYGWFEVQMFSRLVGVSTRTVDLNAINQYIDDFFGGPGASNTYKTAYEIGESAQSLDECDVPLSTT